MTIQPDQREGANTDDLGPSAGAGAAHPADVPRRTRLARSAVATIGGQLATLGITVATTMVLARLLEPADFGRYAMVYTLIVFIGSFRDFGLPMAALQSRDLDHLRSSALFWLNLRITTGVTLFLIAMGPALAWFYGEPGLVALTAAMSVGVLAAALANQHEAALTRQLRFGALVAWDAGCALAGSVAAVGLAAAGAGHWALAAQFILWQVGRAAGIWIVSGWIPAAPSRLGEARRQIGSIVSFGAYLTGYRVLSHAARDLDRVLVGYIGGAPALGLYDSAFKWARLPFQQIYTPLLGVTVAALSHARDDAASFCRNARAILTPVLGLTVPALAFGALAGEPLILVLLGPKWTGAIPIFRWLCVGTIAFAALKTTKWLYVATGHTRRQFRWGLVSSPLFAAAVALGAAFGAEGVAIGFAAANWLLLVPGLAYCLRGTPLGLVDYAALFARPLLASAAAAALAWLVGRTLAVEGQLARLLATAPAFGVAYAGAWLLIPGGTDAARDVAEVIRSVRNRAPRPGRRASRSGGGDEPLSGSRPAGAPTLPVAGPGIAPGHGT